MKEKVIFRKEVTWSHVLTIVTMAIAGLWFAASQNTRVSLIEASDIRQDRQIEESFKAVNETLREINKSVSVIAKEAEYQRGLRDGG